MIAYGYVPKCGLFPTHWCVTVWDMFCTVTLSHVFTHMKYNAFLDVTYHLTGKSETRSISLNLFNIHP